MTETPLLIYVLRLADTSLILTHRLSEWCGHAPMLEEDIALANIGLDLLGQARSLYTYAAEIEGQGRGEDAFAFTRDVSQFRNVLLAEQPNGDFGRTIVRQLIYSAFALPFFSGLKASRDETLAAIAAKAEKEIAYHLRHSAEWVIRLGDGTAESHDRAQTALDDLWPYSGELFEADAVEQALIESGVAADPRGVRAEWEATMDEVLAEATLTKPAGGWMQTGGRKGRHSEHLGHLLAELQFLQRAYPGAEW